MGPRTPSPLLAVLLVTSSSRGATLTFQYPRRPKVEKRYSRVRYHVGEEEKDHFRLHEDEMEDEFESEVELSDEDDDTEESESDSSDLDISDERSDWDAGPSRREFEVASSAGGTGAGVKNTAAGTDQQMKRLRAYQQYLGYDTDILASILAPKRELCHRKFELVIDDLAFVGHPVCVDKDGHWDIESQQLARGRNQLKKSDEGGYNIGDYPPEPATSTLDKSAKAPMNLFHFVLVLDRPDPSPHLPSVDLTSWLQMFYDNIAFKTTAALFAEEVRCEYVTQESEKLGVLRDRCMDDAQSYSSFLTQELNYSSLARSLQQIYSSISSSANAFITVNEVIEVHLQLPPILHDPTRMMRIADVETPIDANDAMYVKQASSGPVDVADLIFEEWTRTTGPYLLPWKTLLLLNGDEKQDQERDADEVSHLDMAAEQQIDSWARKFTSLLKPTLEGIPTFAELADLLGWNVDEDVYPMVRHLIYYREARVIDVPRIQNYYAISPLFDLGNLPSLSTSWSIRFPTLPSLVSFLAKLSSALKPFSVQCRKNERLLCLDALIWLLRHQVILQMHVRLRLVAREEAKKQAAEIRKVERERITAQQQKKQAKRKDSDKKRQAAEAIRLKSTMPSSVLSLSAPANTDPAGEALERGRHRDRSASPLSASASQQQEQDDSTFASALSATRPDLLQLSPKNTNTTIASPLAPSSYPAVSSLADKVEELRFERRPVLRSRSPSRVLAAAAERSLSNRGSSSRPSTPRGRGRLAGHSREQSASLATDLLQQGHPQQQPQSAPATSLKHRPSRREGRASNSSRSPSRARMRVTGFGEGEEVYVEMEGAADKAAKESTQASLAAEEGRRLSRVGEEGEAESSIVLGEMTGMFAPTSEHGSNDETEAEEDSGVESDSDGGEEEEEEEEVMEIEDWETNPKATIITEPSRAGGEENEWIAAMIQDRPPWLAERLFNLLPFLNGKHTIDEIVHRLDWRRKDLRAVLVAFKDEILTLVHP